mmetsp:Transcript_15634/g.28420  ORF Transcript_15634/g.28420 Transcript_15634/m.28420 type:complete len:277 (+) Transcript_15634:676-1506(+)
MNLPMMGDDASADSCTFTQVISELSMEVQRYLPGGKSFTSGTSAAASSSSAPSYLVKSTYCRLPGAGRTSGGMSPPSGIRVSWVTAIHLSSSMSLQYSLLKMVGFSTQAPAYPDDSGWHRPYTWPPHIRATASRSLRPIRPNTSRMCWAKFSHPLRRPSPSISMPSARPYSAPGRRPGAMAYSSVLSTRPPQNGIVGPPVCSMATYAASIHKSAYETLGYFHFKGSKRARASGNRTFSGSLASKGYRIVAPLEPPLPSFALYVPDECHASRIKSGA